MSGKATFLYVVAIGQAPRVETALEQLCKHVNANLAQGYALHGSAFTVAIDGGFVAMQPMTQAYNENCIVVKNKGTV